MKKTNLSEASRRVRDGLVSYILLQQGDTPTDNLAITWVEVLSGRKQKTHSHAPDQAYVIVSGSGRMQVGTQFSDVHAGDLVFIPSDVIHGIENIGSEKLVYVSASVPAFDLEALYDSGQLGTGSDAQRIRIDRESEASHDLIRLLNKPDIKESSIYKGNIFSARMREIRLFENRSFFWAYLYDGLAQA